jgi:5-methylcytosine-specific restriction endonuclease McrA
MGFHNGGNFLELSDVSYVDGLLKDYSYAYYKTKDTFITYNSFSEYIKSRPKDDKFLESRAKDIVYKDDAVEYGDVTFKHFKRPITRDIAEFDSFPIVYEKASVPSKVIQRKWGMELKYKNKEDRIGEIIEFTFLNGKIHSNCVCIEESDYAHHFTIQDENRIFALIISRVEKSFVGLNVHHKYYIQGHKPWDYKDDALVTLCEDCHKRWHEDYSNIRLYDSKGNLLHALIPCDRCGGSGYLPQYSHVEHGICFKCGGEGVIIND